MISIIACESKKHPDTNEITISIDGVKAGFAYPKTLKASAFIYYMRNALDLLEKEIGK